MLNLSSIPIRKEPILNEICEKKQVEYERNSQSKHPALQKIRKPAKLFPHLSEIELVRHFTRLSKQNYAWEDGLYPLGSCTMKYNPIINEKLSANEIFVNLHPGLSEKHTQGALKLLYETQNMIEKIVDLPAATLLPAAGAHGELAGVYMINAYFNNKNEKRKTILIPDSAHGTNPASAAMVGYNIAKVPSTEDGLTDLDALSNLTTEDTAALMITNPNTQGIFETNIIKIKEILNKKGALLFVDGANLNALAGKVSFEKMGVDLSQLNMHKTFSTPHGGGGPGQGVLVCSERMKPYLPAPHVRKIYKDNLEFYEFYIPEKSIGYMKAFYGQFGVIVRAWAYVKTLGSNINQMTERAVLNSRYLKLKLKKYLKISSDLPVLHESVFNHNTLKNKDFTTMHFAKALLDRGFYAPTVFFPLHIPGAIMVEPTETETKQEMDAFVEAVKDIFETIEKNPNDIKNAPCHTFVRKLDEVKAARETILTWNMHK
ncbi:MAG: aminomethyl-transferring glycine dehydrogenase subunit GcvPB [Spirochaetia bacterium]|nr:aminomethyl-transferring glycine dehydrogenase subunit GcvPB [Spirochaetia bacterium]